MTVRIPAEDLADTWTEKWVEALERRGITVTPEGRKRYREAMIGIARLKIMNESYDDQGAPNPDRS